jgi:hypothetical protein
MTALSIPDEPDGRNRRKMQKAKSRAGSRANGMTSQALIRSRQVLGAHVSENSVPESDPAFHRPPPFFSFSA